jgi:hypothetical protein
MKRRTFDQIVSFVGLGLSVLLLVAAGLLNWGATFASDTVKQQLEQQRITMPAADSAGFKALPAEAQSALKPFDAMPLTTGKQAQAYADFYIGSHLKGIAGGKAASRAAPNDLALAEKAGALMGQRTTLFMGETLRGVLLTAYAFWQLGEIAMYASYAAAIGGVLMLILALMGFAHIRRVEADATI